MRAPPCRAAPGRGAVWTPTRVALVLILGWSMLACTADPATPGGPRFTKADIEGIVLMPIDAPRGTTWSSSVSGFQDLASFARDPAESTKLQGDGFVVGYLSLFPPTGHSEPGQAPVTDPAAPFLQGVTGLFRSADGAASALHRFVEDLRARQLPGAAAVDPPAALGDDAFGLDGSASDGTHVVVFAWRDGNLVLGVSGAGSLGGADRVGPLAELVQRRARTAAGGSTGG